MKHTVSSFSIAAVEREVGVSKDVLRVWERRYGFPAPDRDPGGERIYPAEQVRRLVLVKRLMDRGFRPGKLLKAPIEELEAQAAGPAVASRSGAPARSSVAPEVLELMALVRSRDALALAEGLQQRLARVGLERFVLDIVSPMAVLIGADWACGELQIHEEHLFTELVQRALRQAVAQLPRGRAPTILLTTVPDEPHALVLVMLEALLTLHGARCINLGPQLPLLEIARAAQDHQAHVVALSFSAAFPARQVTPLVQQLRAVLPSARQLWIGGAGSSRMGPVEGAHRLHDFTAAIATLAGWQEPA